MYISCDLLPYESAELGISKSKRFLLMYIDLLVKLNSKGYWTINKFLLIIKFIIIHY